MCLAPPLTELNNYTVIMDGAPGPDISDNDFSLMLVDNPVATLIRQESRRVDLGLNNSIIIIEVRFCAITIPLFYCRHFK